MDSGDIKIKMKSNDGKVIEISKKAAFGSEILKGMIGDFPDDAELPLNKVDGETLEKVKEYLVHYENNEPSKIEIPLKSINFKECVSEWDYNYLGEDIEIIFKLMDAANFMNIKNLLALTSAKLGSNIKGTTSESVKKDFEIGELTQEEKEQILNDKKFLEGNI